MKQFSKELGKVSITPKGDWNSSIANEKLDIVYDRRNNQAYIAKQDVPIGVDIDNREYWQPLNVSGYADNNFINLTAENENGTITAYESLEEAVATIFPINRRVGATLSFYNLNSDRLDRQAEFELWQFNSTDLANWENKDYWNNIYYNWNVFAGWYIDADALKNHVEIPNVGQYAYVGSNLNDAILYQCRTNGTWTNTGIKVRNYISVVVSGNITIGENGNWFSDGEDTGIPATPAVDEQLDNIITKHESLSRTVQGIAVTGGASTATNVTYNNDNSGLNAENAQDAIDEVSSIGYFAKRGGIVNISTNYNSDHIAEVLTLSQALSKVPSTDMVLGFQGKYLATDGWHTIIYIGNSLTSWSNTTKWIDLADKVFNSISNNSTFAGIATPATNPSTPDGNVFYIATEPGTYSNFGGLSIKDGEAAILEWKGTWSKKSGLATITKLNQVAAKAGYLFELSKGFITPGGEDGKENDLRVRTSPIFEPFEYELNDGIVLISTYYYNLDGTFISQGKPNHSNYYKRLVFGKSDGSNINPIIDEIFRSYSLANDILKKQIEDTESEVNNIKAEQQNFPLRAYLFEPYVNPIVNKSSVDFNLTKIVKEIIPLDNFADYYKSDGTLRKFYIYGIGMHTTEQFIIGIRYEKDDGQYETTGHKMVSAEKTTDLWIEVGKTLRFKLLIDTTYFYNGEILTYIINPTLENSEFSSTYLENQFTSKKADNNKKDIESQAAVLTSLNFKVDNLESLTNTMVYPKNLYNKSKQIAGENGAENGYLDDSGSVVIHKTAKVSYYIPIQSGVEYFAQDMYGTGTRYCTYGVNKELIRVVYRNMGNNAPVDAVCTFNSDEAFVRFSIRDINKFMLSKAGEKQPYEEGFEPYAKVTEKMLNEISKNLKICSGLEGLKIVAFGDSVTDGKVDSASDSSVRVTWVETLAKMIGSRYLHLKATTSSMQSGPYENIVNYDVFNMGSSGMRITYKKDGSTVEEWTDSKQIGELGGLNTNNVLYNWFRRFEMLNTKDGKKLIEPDIFIIAAGTNDVSQGSDKGEISDAFNLTANYPNDLDTLDNTKMTSALKRVLLYIQINYPKAKIYYCTPIHGGYGGRTLQALGEVADKNTEVCGYMNVEVIDLFKKSGINGIFENQQHIDAGDTRDTIDGVHVRQSGADKQAKTIFNVCRATY